MAEYDNCMKCKKGFECGWSFIDPEGYYKPDISQMVDEPCDNLCEPTVFDAKKVNTEGLCRVFEAAAMREYNDKCTIPGRKGRKRKPVRHKRGGR